MYTQAGSGRIGEPLDGDQSAVASMEYRIATQHEALLKRPVRSFVG